MEYRVLGATGLTVSEIALGTVEFGLDYGFRGSPHYRKPDTSESIRTIHAALDRGVNLIDTARAYGSAEETVGLALAQASSRPYIASKLSIPTEALADGNFEVVRNGISGSVDTSLRALRADCLDLLQIHNTSSSILSSPEVLEMLLDLKKEGKVRHLGASCYGEELPLQAMDTGCFGAVQVAFSLLDQSMRRKVMPTAAALGIGILVRSAFMRGVLTPQVHTLPERLAPLKKAALEALVSAGAEAGSLAELALRYCLSFSGVSSVIIGVRSVAEVEANLENAAKGPLDSAIVAGMDRFAIDDETLVNATNWNGLI